MSSDLEKVVTKFQQEGEVAIAGQYTDAIIDDLENNSPSEIASSDEAKDMRQRILDWAISFVHDLQTDMAHPETVEVMRSELSDFTWTAAEQRYKEEKLEQGTLAKKWKTWVEEASAAGAAALHRWGRLPDKKSLQAVRVGDNMSALPMDVLVAQQQKWQKTWRCTDGSEKVDSHIAPVSECNDEDKYSPENLIRSARTFRKQRRRAWMDSTRATSCSYRKVD